MNTFVHGIVDSFFFQSKLLFFHFFSFFFRFFFHVIGNSSGVPARMELASPTRKYTNSLRIQQDSEEKLRRYNLDTNIISFVHAIGSQDNGAILLNFYHSPID